MKTNLKKFAALILAVLFVCCLAACGGEQQKVSVIGISQYGEHESLDNCRLGFLQGLKDAGLTEGVDYVIDYQNAGFDDNIVKQIAESFSANNVALMCGIATPSAMACYAAAENKNIPVIFTEVNGSDATAKAIARETGCTVAQLSMCMDGPDGALSNYGDVLRNNVAAIINGFAGEELVR